MRSSFLLTSTASSNLLSLALAISSLPLVHAFCPALRASDWPHFRGPASSGASKDAAIPTDPKVAWSASLPGRGLSSPIVIGEKVFVTASAGPDQQQLQVLCFNAKTGEPLWKRQLQATGRTMTYAKTSVAANTPCSDGKHVFALWSSNDLAAFDLDGNLAWLRGLTADYSNASNSLGMASSPVVVGKTVVVVIENDSESYSLGIDAATGKNLWKLERPKAANWSSPVPLPAKNGAPLAVLLQSKKGLIAVDAATGKKLWEHEADASTMSSSTAVNDTVYAPVSGITALSTSNSAGAPQILWNSRQINPSTISPLLLDDKLFSVNGAGILTMAETKSGDVKWKLRLTGPFSGSPVGAGTRIALINEKALLQIVDSTAPEGALIGQIQLPLNESTKELTLCTPALAGNRIFVRTDSTLWCLGE
jgi:outer membrane protein assembly factor BamB